jgi:stearoyl-CoA desaturase (delta-9 desaturase)
VLAALTVILWGLPGLFIAYGLSTVLCYHATFTVNSLAHRFGSRRYATPDRSRNNWFVALIMLGGGWHNNHHHDPRSARQGVRWWEIDVTYYVLVVLGWLGVVHDIRVPRELPAVKAIAGRRSRGRSPRSY